MQAILAAAGCRQLSEIREIVTKHGQVILGSMDGSRLNSLVDAAGGREIPVYFYETG
ncbi:hypothetical protein [Desulforamulus putei]|uniref:Uncharacterized protein n=1 Tax=Desulforamulus putei DSM 12395 TaxID=1121429 RepID=A0A1M4XI73_9FIRM|nr:hypothetical protein [Desulforamulus putei]SHE92862.1 hypothetical protein SAMN02745133_01454 [Desulforamulus putei DSM 12395]